MKVLGIALPSPRLVAVSAYRVRDRLASAGCPRECVTVCVFDTALPQCQCDNPQHHDMPHCRNASATIRIIMTCYNSRPRGSQDAAQIETYPSFHWPNY